MMRLLFIRHGEPDYVHDTLTEKGWREAGLLAKAAPSMNLGTCYVSPLGRAQDTASLSLAATGKTAETLPWLREFFADFDLNRSVALRGGYPCNLENGVIGHAAFWDMYPAFWNGETIYLDPVGWRDSLLVTQTDIAQVYDAVTVQFDELLASHGYVREGNVYRVEKESDETLTFFCHFGITSALIAHLWSVSPFTFWFHAWMAPTAVSELISEERVEGTAHFRSQRIADVSHLYAGGEEPSFAGRFCECYHQEDKRH